MMAVAVGIFREIGEFLSLVEVVMFATEMAVVVAMHHHSIGQSAVVRWTPGSWMQP
jgi:hypothetical protein